MSATTDLSFCLLLLLHLLLLRLHCLHGLSFHLALLIRCVASFWPESRFGSMPLFPLTLTLEFERCKWRDVGKFTILAHAQCLDMCDLRGRSYCCRWRHLRSLKKSRHSIVRTGKLNLYDSYVGASMRSWDWLIDLEKKMHKSFIRLARFCFRR